MNIIKITHNPSPLETYAAEELRRYLDLIFNLNMQIIIDGPHESSTAGGQSGVAITLWARRNPPETEDGAQTSGTAELSKQGFLLRKTGGNRFLIAGRSPQALLWGVYELAERWGVVFSLQGDVLPTSVPDELLPDIDETFEPLQTSRCWRVYNDLMIGPASWSLSQQKKVIGQLAKQKYNEVLLSMWPMHPFVDYRMGGIARRTAALNFGMKFPVTRDNIGAEHLIVTDNYLPSDFRDCHTFNEWHEAARIYAREVMEYARFFGMRITLAFQPFDFNPEFAPLLEKPDVVNQLGGTLVYENGNIFGENHIRLLQAQFQAYMETYPQVDTYQIGLPEHGRNASGFDDALQSLDRRFNLSSKYDIEAMLYDEIGNQITAGGPERAVNDGKMTLVMLDTLHKLLEMTGFLNQLQQSGKHLSLTAGMTCAGLLPVISESLWPDARLALALGYTASRSVRNLRFIEGINTEKVRVIQTLTLQDDNIGAVPQVATRSIDCLLRAGINKGFQGYCTRFWPIGDLDPVSAYLSKASWDRSVTPERAYHSFIGRLWGEECIQPMTQALTLMEDATILLDIPLRLIFPASGAMSEAMGSQQAAVARNEFWHIASTYKEIKNMLLKCECTDETAKAHRDYWISRLEFGIRILLGVLSVDEGNRKLALSEKETARAAYEKALVRFREALEAAAETVRDDSDRGLLAVYYHILIRQVGEKLGELFGGQPSQ